MTDNGRYFGFEIKHSLYQEMIANLQRIEAGGPCNELSGTAADHLVTLIQEGVIAYYERPASLIELPSWVRKAADAGMSTISKAAEMVIHRLIANRSLEELQVVADDVRHLICLSSTESTSYLCFPLPDHLYERASTLLARVREDDRVDLYRSEIIHSLEDLIEEAIGVFYTAPLTRIQVGRMTRAASDLGIGTVKKGTSMVLNKVFKTMPHAELLPLAGYFETLLHQNVVPYAQASQPG